MAVPQNKVSRARRDKRRAHHALPVAHRTKCTNCGAAVRPHSLCETCGVYRGRTLLKIEEL